MTEIKQIAKEIEYLELYKIFIKSRDDKYEAENFLELMHAIESKIVNNILGQVAQKVTNYLDNLNCDERLKQLEEKI